MSTAESAELVATIRLKDEFRKSGAAFVRTIQDMDRRTQKLQSAVGTLGKGLKTGLVNSAKLAAGAVAFLGYNIKQGIDELVQWEDAQLQVSAALKSTHGAARVTAQMTEELATKYAELVLAEDDVILSAEAMILRFPNVRKKAFEPTLAAALDLAQATGQEVPQAAKLMSMAMSDPIGALGRLERYTGKFTDRQKEQIKTLVESGHLFKAQGIILDKVNAKFGGSAQKATEGYRGNMIRLNKAIKGLQQNLAEPLLKPITRIARALSDFATRPEVIQGLKDFGTALAGLATEGNIQKASDALASGFDTIKNLDWSTILTGIKTAGQIGMEGIKLFTALPANVQGTLLALLAGNKLTGGLVGDVFKGLTSLVWTGLKTITATNVTVIGANVTGGGVPGGAAGAAGTGAGSVARAGIGVVPFLGGVAGAMALNQLFYEDRNTGNIAQNATFNPGAPSSMSIGIGTGFTTNEMLAVVSNMVFQQIARTFGGAGYQNNQVISSGTRSGFFTGPENPNSVGRQNQFVSLANDLYKQGKLSGEKFNDIAMAVVNGNKTYKQAVAELRQIKGAQGEVKDAIKGQQYQFTLKPSVTISASATGNAITFAANGQRLIIQ